MKIQQFDGGLATRLAPQFIAQNQGVEYENILSTTGVLEPVLTPLATAISVAKYNTFFVKDQEWVGSATPTTYLEYQNILYSASGTGRPIKRSSGVDNFLGIEPPVALATLQHTAIEPLEVFNVQNDITVGDLPGGELAYRLYSEVGTGASLILSVPMEFIVSETNTTTPASTSVVTAGLVDQEEQADIKTLTPIGINPYIPTYQTVDTKPTGSLRSITIDDILGLSLGKYSGASLYRYYEGTWRLLASLGGGGATTYTDSVYDISANAALDESTITAFNGTYQYVYTYYNSADGTESAPSPLSEEQVAQSNSIAIDMVASADPQVTHQRIYRVGGLRTVFAMVAEVAAGTTLYSDTLLDTEMDGRLLESENYYAAPEGLSFISESYAMLFGSIGYTLYFTPIGVPNAWPPEFSLQFNSDITGIGPVANGVLVMTETQTFIVTGTGPTTLAVQTLRGDQGCISHFSIQEVQKGALVWASTDGLCSSSGSNVVSITKSSLGDTRLDVVNSAVVDEVYYLQLVDGTTLLWDYRFSPIFKVLNLSLESVTAANSEIYGWADNVMYELFKGATKSTLQYLSPRFVEGSLTETKTYKKVYISHDGDIIINIIINDILVATKALTGKDTTVVQVPQAEQRGYYIQFEFTGTGLVNELEYTVSGRKDG